MKTTALLLLLAACGELSTTPVLVPPRRVE